MWLDTKTYWLTNRQSQCDFDFYFEWVWELELENWDELWKVGRLRWLKKKLQEEFIVIKVIVPVINTLPGNGELILVICEMSRVAVAL
jgi:hypothetical protein